MSNSSQIISNFKTYNNFLSTLENEDKRIATSLKMMYSIHMENNNVNKNNFFILKQVLRFIIKLLTIAFYKTILNSSNENVQCAVVSSSYIEKYIAKKSAISLISFQNKIAINLKLFIIYKELFRTIYILLQEPTLNKKYIWALMHRLIDYLNVYHNVSISTLNTVFIENDRTPVNLALIHCLREYSVKTVKYDNWLIDRVNHNDIYCEYYFYPSQYHKKIIQSFASNRDLKYIEGGFLYWDNLKNYLNTSKFDVQKIVYFTQFGVSIDLHKEYIGDIVDIMEDIGVSYELIVKIHPRENVVDYQHLLVNFKNIKIIDIVDDIYQLIAQSDFCFSIFSTISLEAKHIVKNSYFINYDAANFDIIDYNALKLDTIKSKKILKQVLKKDYVSISQTEFIKYGNCKYPYSIESLGDFFCHE